MLTREVETNRQVYESMLNRVNETSMSSAMRAGSVRVVDAGVPPATPFKPVLPVNLLWGGSIGLLVGIVLTVVSERADGRIRRPGELAHFLSVPELGAVPSASAGSQGFRPAAVSDQASEELAAWQQRSSQVAESFRDILASVLLANGQGDAPRVIVVTSALAAEGKTMVASNLAVAMARTGKKVLLIDGDFRRPRLHQLFNVTQDYGLLDLLTADQRDYRDLLSYVIHETSIPGAYLLVSGPKAANPDLLLSEAMTGLVGQARESFDMVIIDTAPMLEASDARLLGRISDGVILVVRAGGTSCDVALKVKERLQADGVRVLGTVLNSWRPS
jgi:capsular exopolysaccharide synthesis family protein